MGAYRIMIVNEAGRMANHMTFYCCPKCDRISFQKGNRFYARNKCSHASAYIFRPHELKDIKTLFFQKKVS